MSRVTLIIAAEISRSRYGRPRLKPPEVVCHLSLGPEEALQPMRMETKIRTKEEKWRVRDERDEKLNDGIK